MLSSSSSSLFVLILTNSNHEDFIDIPEIISNLQANTVYWRECSEAQQLLNHQQNQQQNQHLQIQSQDKISLNHNKSIQEDCENETESDVEITTE